MFLRGGVEVFHSLGDITAATAMVHALQTQYTVLDGFNQSINTHINNAPFQNFPSNNSREEIFFIYIDAMRMRVVIQVCTE